MATAMTEFKQADLKILTPTRSLINRFAEMEPAPGDRPLRDYLTKDLRRKYFDGQFRSCLWASVKCKATKKEYRLNGKHSSKLFQSMNGEFKPYFKIELEDWGTVDTLDEVSELYARYDPAKSARKTGDINRSVAATIPEIAEFSEMLINHCVSGIAFAKHGEADMSITTPYHRAELLRTEVQFVVWMQGIIGEAKAKDGRHLWRRPVASAMYLTFHKSRKDATEFWNKVKVGEGEPASPERKVERYLLTSALNSGRASNGAKPVGRTEMLAKCLHGWNAWRTKTATNLAYHPSAGIPKVQ